MHALHSSNIDKMYTPYIVPSENGSRCDTRWLGLSSVLSSPSASSHSQNTKSLKTKKTVSLSITRPPSQDKEEKELLNKNRSDLFSFSTSNYSIDELNDSTHWLVVIQCSFLYNQSWIISCPYHVSYHFSYRMSIFKKNWS